MKKKPARGRPEKPSSDKRERYLQVRVSEEEKAICDAAAKRSGLELSQWVRMSLRKTAKTEE